MSALKQHPLSARFPAMEEEEFNDLVKDIKSRGLKHSIILHENMVADGWHRLRACEKAGVKPIFSTYGKDDIEEHTWSTNFYRRHLSTGARALLVVERSEWQKIGRPISGTNVPPTNEEMANEAKTSTRVIKEAKQVAERGSEALKDAVKDDKVSVHAAAKATKLPKAKQVKAAKEIKEKKPKPEKAPKVESVTKEKHSELADKYNELVDRNKELATEMENLTAIQDGDAAKQMKKLQALLDQANRSRDEAMNKAAALQKQNKYLEGELKKLGWKRDKP